MEETVEIRAGVELIFIDNKLMEVTCNQHTRPSIYNIDIFSDPEAPEKLEKYSDVIKSDTNSYWLYPKLGVCIGGIFGKRIPEKKLSLHLQKIVLNLIKYFWRCKLLLIFLRWS